MIVEALLELRMVLMSAAMLDFSREPSFSEH
jgi:hypothetical protein